MKNLLRAVSVSSVLFGALLLAPSFASAAPAIYFSATISPTTSAGSATQTYTLTITNGNNGAAEKISFASTTIPSGWSIVGSVTASSSWTATVVGSVINLQGGTDIAPNTSLNIMFSATAPSSAGVGTWTVTAYKSDHAHSQFTITSAQPTVTVTVTDTTAPSSQVTTTGAIGGYASSSPTSVDFTASDDTSVASTSLYYSFNGGSYTPFGTQTGTSGSFAFTFPSGDGTYDLYTRASDTAGNMEAAPVTPPDATIIYDATAPSAPPVSSPADGTRTNAGGIAMSGAAAEPGSTITISGGSSTVITTADGAGAWSTTIPLNYGPDVDTTNNLSVTATDAAGNTSSATTLSVVMDNTPPVIVLSTGESSPTNNPAIGFSIDLSEAVVDLTSSSVTVPTANATIDSFSMFSSTHYTFTLVPTAEGTTTVTIPGSAVHDAANNATSSTSYTLVFASTTPSVNITSPTASEVLGTNSIDMAFTPTPSPSSGLPITDTQCALDSGGFVTCDTTTSHTFSGVSPDGVHTVYVLVTDSAANSALASVDVGINTAGPAVTGSSVVTDEDTATSSAVNAATDSYIPGTLTYGVVSGPSNGDLTFNSDGTFTYTPSSNYNGSDSFTFEGNDGAASSSAPATVDITINPVNDAPQLDAISNQSVTVGDTASFTASATDPEGDTVTFELSGAPAGATIDPATGAFSWDTTGASTGDYTFSVIAGDGNASTTLSPTITVSSVPTTPPTTSGGGGGGPIGLFGTVSGGGHAIIPTAPAGAGGQGQVLGAAAFNFTKNLYYGLHSTDVAQLQQFLVAEGYSIPDAVTNYFGPETLAAVKAFQKANGIPATGFVGPLTRAVLNQGTQ